MRPVYRQAGANEADACMGAGYKKMNHGYFNCNTTV